MVIRPPFSLLKYKNFSNYAEFLNFLRMVDKNFSLSGTFQFELYSSNILKLWGCKDALEALNIENTYKKYSYFNLKYDKNTLKGFLNKISIIFRKDLETFMFVLDPCTRFCKTFDLAPKFFGFILLFANSNFFFSYLQEFCSFVSYERKRQKEYLPLQVKELDRNLFLAAEVLDFFGKRDDRPEIYFSLKELFDNLKCISDTYRKTYFSRQEDIRIVY